jgi:predicted short-subunit dehydrogenase-like oxidoreductase (DUF2520 family)
VARWCYRSRVGAPLPLRDLTFSVAGPGRVGASLSAWLEARGARRIAATGRAGLPDLVTAGQELLLVAVPDPVLPAIATELARRPQAAVVLHTSGSLDAGALAPLRAAGSAVGTLHPLKAFPHPLPDPEQARGVFFAVDGDPPARALAFRLAAAWDAEAAEVPATARSLYHFAATLAAGGVVTLLAAAEEIAERLGLPEAVTRGYLELCKGAVAAAAEAHAEGHALGAALTGPVARGDRATVARHLEALRDLTPEKLPLTRALARETLRQRGRGSELGPGHGEVLSELEREE